MAIPWKAVAVGGAIAGGLGAIVLANRKTVPMPVGRVALIGDSYAVGLGPELAKIFPDFKYEGHVGNSSAQWAAHSTACGSCGDWLTVFKPDIVLVSLGVNDGATPNRKNYNDIVSGLHGLGARVIWIAPPANVNSPEARAIIYSLGVSTVPGPTLPMANSLHPTSDGYRIWAGYIAAAVVARA